MYISEAAKVRLSTISTFRKCPIEKLKMYTSCSVHTRRRDNTAGTAQATDLFLIMIYMVLAKTPSVLSSKNFKKNHRLSLSMFYQTLRHPQDETITLCKANQASEVGAKPALRCAAGFLCTVHLVGVGKMWTHAPQAGSPTHLEVGEPDFTFAAASTCVSAGVTLSHL